MNKTGKKCTWAFEHWNAKRVGGRRVVRWAEGDFTLSLMDGWSELTGGAKKMMKGRRQGKGGLWEWYVR